MISIVLALKDCPSLTVLSYHLERYGFIVNSAQNQEETFLSIERIDPKIIVIDEEIADNSSLKELFLNIRNKQKHNNSYIILLCKEQPQGIHSINDYILKPFVPSEFVNKIKSFTSQLSASRSATRILNYNGIEMFVDSFRVTRSGREIHLGPTEFKILQCFLELPEKVLSREHIMNSVWGHGTDIEPRTIDVHINRLRLVLKEDDDEMSLIRTIRSAGYSLNIVKKLVEAS